MSIKTKPVIKTPPQAVYSPINPELPFFNIFEALKEIVARTPVSSEEESQTPFERAHQLKQAACLKSAAISGTLAIPPGPMGMLTILPDLMAIWTLQQQLVSDIANCFGKRGVLTREVMLYCLFRHGAAFLARDLIVRTGERILVRRVALRTFQQLLKKIGIQITQKTIGRSLSRWVPILGAAGVAAYSYYDTKCVAETAIELFSQPVVVDEETSDQPD
jgi:hypothetical protein